MYKAGINQAKNLGIDVLEEEVIKIEMDNKINNENIDTVNDMDEGNIFKVITSKNIYNSKNIVIAAGLKRNAVNIKGVKELEGQGVSYCAICDGFFYKNKDVVVIGSGDYAISETNDLINVVNKITILTNGERVPEFRADNVNVETKNIKEISRENRVCEIKFQDESSIKADGVFVAQGTAGPIDLAKKLGVVIKNNKIVVNDKMQTNIKGIYACGDCTEGIKQIAKAVYEGAVVGLDIISK